MLYTACGVANTVTMLTSGYFAVRALLAIRRNDRRSARNWLIGTLLGGLAFLGIKAWSSAGTSTTASWAPATASWRCTTTGPSITCAWWGCLGLIWVILRNELAAWRGDHEGLEAATLYWHATDLAWIVIFPLFYVLR